MPYQDWLSGSQARGIVAAAALSGLALICGGEYYQRHASDAAGPASRLNNPRLYQPNCEAPEDREESDLCAQRVMAVAARDVYNITVLQFWAGLLGLGALGFTLYYTRRAVNAAIDANDINRNIGERQIRAYLTITDCQLVLRPKHDQAEFVERVRSRRDDEDVGGPMRIGVEVACKISYRSSGQTPAYDLRTELTLSFCGHGIQPMWARRSRRTPTLAAQQDAEIVLDEALASESWMATPARWREIAGVIEYRDVFGTERYSRFHFRSDDARDYGKVQPDICADGNETS